MELPRLYLKNEVHVNGAHFYSELVAILNAARATAPMLQDNAVWVTSANDSNHMEGSLHYRNRAFDIRTWNITGPMTAMSNGWVKKMKLILGDDYDIICEKDHIHCEYDPKEI